MKVVITGGAGFVGSRLADTLLRDGGLQNAQGEDVPVRQLVIVDQMAPHNLPDDGRVKVIVGQVNDPQVLAEALAGADSVFHLASVVSGGAEADLQLGLSVNLDGTRLLLDMIAGRTEQVKLIFASSIAVYGGGATRVDDATAAWPQSSYGVQKVCCELLIGDYSRRGLIDGRSLRFPTIGIRPGKPNKANSSFVSNIVREPLAGRVTVCPVGPETEMALMSPGRLVQAIIRAHNLGNEEFGWPRTLLLPSVRVSVAQLLDALETRAGPAVRDLVHFEKDDAIHAMVSTWPANLEAARAAAFGIRTNRDALEIVDEYIFDHGDKENGPTG